MAITSPPVLPTDIEYPVRGSERTLFATTANTFNKRLVEEFVPQLNAMVEWMETTATEVEGLATTVSDNTSLVEGYKNTASGFADDAETAKNDSQDILDSNTVIAAAVQSAAGLPSLVSNGGKALTVKLTEDGVEWGGGTGERLTFSKTFRLNEEKTFLLSSDAFLPVVSVAKEVSQSGVSNNYWNVDGDDFGQRDAELDINETNITLKGSLSNYSVLDASYDSVSFSVSSQDSDPIGITFNGDGTKLFMVGSTDNIFQYTLTTGFDLSTASYDSVSFSVTSQDSIPRDITFNDDGTKLFMIGFNTKAIYQYTLTTGFDLSTASYDSVSFSVSSQDSGAYGITFNGDGTKLFMVGSTNARIYQYTLSTGFDLSTASYDSVSFSVSSQDSLPAAAAFNAAGSRLIVAGRSTKAIYQYTLSTGFDLSTASYDSVSFSVTSQDSSPVDMIFNNDGSGMFVLGATSDTIYQYSTQGVSYETSLYATSITNTSGQIYTNFWTDINSMTASETLNTQTILYALSNDDRTTWQIGLTGNSPRNIARNNGGTWQFNSDVTYASETWSDAASNNEYDAISEAMSVAANQMDSTQIGALTDAEQIVLGSELDLSVILYTDDAAETPVYEGLTINYDANSRNQAAILGTDYEWWSQEEGSITIKALAANNLKGRVL